MKLWRTVSVSVWVCEWERERERERVTNRPRVGVSESGDENI